MPKPPLLVSPSPNESIASATWGAPVTDAVNGLTTGQSRVGVICSNTGTGQGLGTSTANVTLPTPIYDSDGFFDGINTHLLKVPPGLAGLYEIGVHIGTDTAEQGKGMRMGILLSGIRISQVNITTYSASASLMTAGLVLRMEDGDTISFNAAGNHTGAIKMTTKIAWMWRIADLPPAEDVVLAEGV